MFQHKHKNILIDSPTSQGNWPSTSASFTLRLWVGMIKANVVMSLEGLLRMRASSAVDNSAQQHCSCVPSREDCRNAGKFLFSLSHNSNFLVIFNFFFRKSSVRCYPISNDAVPFFTLTMSREKKSMRPRSIKATWNIISHLLKCPTFHLKDNEDVDEVLKKRV